MKKNLISLFFSCLCVATFAQTPTQKGEIAGQVKDETGELLPGVNIWIDALKTGTSTDIDGYFVMKVPVGTYTLQISYISYQSQQIEAQVQAEERLQLQISLVPEAIELEEVEVQAERLRDNELALTDMRRKSVHVLEGLSVEQMRRSGDNDLGSAMRRMTGITVEDGQYVYVRGLGDRYSKTFFNGANIPGLDPNRNSTHMDLFPAHLIDNVVVYKAFSAELPGDFAGGYVDIQTKSVPEGPTFHVSSSLSYNPNANFNRNYLTYTGSSTDWLGMDNGLRKQPQLLKQGIPELGKAERDPAVAAQLGAATRAFGSQEMTPYQKAMPPDHRYLLLLGNKYRLFGNPLGYMLTLSYQRGFDSYYNGFSGIYKQRGSSSYTLTPQLDLEDTRSGEDVLWGSLLSLGYQLAPKHKLTLNGMHTQKGNKVARSQAGTKPSEDPHQHYFTQGLWYTQKSISSFQLKGKHGFNIWLPLQVKWVASHTFSRMYQPDLRFFTYGHRDSEQGEDIQYDIRAALGQLPTRYFRDMLEQVSDIRLHFIQDLGAMRKLKTGAAFSLRKRGFDESQYAYNSPQVALVPEGNPDAYISEENIWDTENLQGTYVAEASIAANNYDAQQRIWATYALWEQSIFDKRMTLGAGLRYEGTQLSLISEDDTQSEGHLLLQDLLPSLRMTYRTAAEQIVLRTAYGRTIARPSFRELAPFASFDFIGDYIRVGNPQLTRTQIDNIDLSAEYYPQAGAFFSLGFFYKHFRDPIERTFNIEAPTTELTFRNVPKAQALGIEVSAKQPLESLGNFFTPFSVGANFSLIHSWVRIDEEELRLLRAYDASALPQRPMYGQAPYVFNTQLNYEHRKGLDAAISYNIFGKRSSIITPTGPDVYEMPRHSLNISLAKRFSKYWQAGFSVNNLLDSPFQLVQDFQNEQYFAQRHQTGRRFSMSLSYTIER